MLVLTLPVKCLINKPSIFILSGLPISKIEYPAITICSQGWISGVTKRAINYQFLTYAESKGHDLNNMTTVEKDELKEAYLAGARLVNVAICWLLLSVAFYIHY